METTIVLKCNCENTFQDKEYGKGMRLHNIHQKDKNKKLAYCTVCSPSQRRNKFQKTTEVKDGKIWGMTYPAETIGPRKAKTF